MSLLNKNLFLVKEHIGLFKASNNFDIFDPEDGTPLMECREPNLFWLTKLLRFTDAKRFTPFDIQIRTVSGERMVRVVRGLSLLLSKVEVRDANNELVGYFSQKLFSIGGRFDVLDKEENVICTLEGTWMAWNFYFKQGDTTLAHVTKKWKGLGAEMFTSADNYVLEINPEVPQNSDIRKLILAAVMCIDMVLKE
ncbi:MAG: RNAase [Gammaproteobacteria bacterium]|nr:RNAase [Gammaproteobacteria bacterium]